MPAHLRRSLPACYDPGCRKTATVELRSTWNAVLGVYCVDHGRDALKREQDRERSKLAARKGSPT